MKLASVKIRTFAFFLLVITLLFSLSAGIDLQVKASNGTSDWPTEGYNSAHINYNPLENTLKPPLSQAWKHQQTDDYWYIGTPVMAEGTIYATAYNWNSRLYAIDANNGTIKWSYDMWRSYYATSVYGSPAVWSDKVYINTAHSTVYALNKNTGDLIWKKSLGFGGGISNHASPIVANGILYIGTSSGYDQTAKNKVYALDAENGNIVWTFEAEDKFVYSAAYYNNTIYIPGHLSKKLYALDATTGNLKWIYDPGTAGNLSTPAIANDLIYLSGGNKTFVLDADTGDVQWTYAAGGDTPAVAGSTVLLSGSEQRVYALNALTGTFIWVRTLDGIGAPRVANGVVYVQGDNKVHALDLADGFLLDSLDLEIWSPTPIIANGRLYVAGRYNFYAYKYDPSLPEPVRPRLLSTPADWPSFGYDAGHTNYNQAEKVLRAPLAFKKEYPNPKAESNLHVSPTVARDAMYVISNPWIMGGSAWLSAIDVESGDIKWEGEITPPGTLSIHVYGPPTVALGKVFVNSAHNQLYAWDEATGVLIWKRMLEHPWYGVSNHNSPVYSDGYLYVGTSGGNEATAKNKVYALDAETGHTIWAFEAEDKFAHSAAVNNGIAYIHGTITGKLYALDAKTGTLRWTFNSGGSYSPAVANGFVYFGAAGKTYALDANTGIVRWTYDVPSSQYAVAYGRVYFGSGKKIYSLDSNTGALLWSTSPLGEQRQSYHPPVVANGFVYVKEEDSGLLIQIDAITGAKVCSHKIDKGGAPPVVANGKLFIGTGYQKIHSFETAPISLRWRVRTYPDYWNVTFYANGVGSDGQELCPVEGAEIKARRVRPAVSEWLTFSTDSSGQVTFGGPNSSKGYWEGYATYKGALIAYIRFNTIDGEEGISPPPDSGTPTPMPGWSEEERLAIRFANLLPLLDGFGAPYKFPISESYSNALELASYNFDLYYWKTKVTLPPLFGALGLAWIYLPVPDTNAAGLVAQAFAEYQRALGFEVVYQGQNRAVYRVYSEGAVSNVGINIFHSYSSIYHLDDLSEYEGIFKDLGLDVSWEIFGAYVGTFSSLSSDVSGRTLGLSIGTPAAPVDFSGTFPEFTMLHNWKGKKQLNFFLSSPADLLVIDPNGKRIGVDPNTGFVVNEIPGANFSSPDAVPEMIIIPEPIDGNYTIQVIGTGEGEFHLIAQTVDEQGTEREREIASGNIFKGEVVTLEFNTADNIPPTTTIKPDPSAPNGANDWYISDVAITLEAIDNEGGSGVEKTEYSVDGGYTWNLYSGPFTINTEGTTTILARSTDNAGNLEEPPAQVEIRIDTTTSTTSLAIGDPKYGTNPTYVTSSTEFILSATDDISGIATTQYKIDSGVWTPYTTPFTVSGEGNHIISYRSTDNTGNVEQTKTLDIYVDNTPPTTTDNVPAGWQNTDTIITLSPIDTGSGVAATYYTMDGTTPTVSSSQGTSVSFTSDGIYTLKYFSVDNLGNIESIRTALNQLRLDKTSPETSATLAGTTGTNGWYTSDVTVSLSATDNLSGVLYTEYSLDGGVTWGFYYGLPFILGLEGYNTVLYRSIDVAGNLEATKALTVKIDKIPPEAHIQFDPDVKDISVMGIDNLGGPVAVSYVETDQYGNDEHGKKTRTYTLTDEAGNSTTLVLEFKKEGHEIKVEVLELNYKGSAPITLPENSLKFEWALNKGGVLKELNQKFEVEDQFEIEAKYQGNKNTTRIEIEEEEQEQEFTQPGLVLIKLLTSEGALHYSYD